MSHVEVVLLIPIYPLAERYLNRGKLSVDRNLQFPGPSQGPSASFCYEGKLAVGGNWFHDGVPVVFRLVLWCLLE